MNEKKQTQRPAPEYLLLGKILRPHGVQGEMRMTLLTDFPDRLKQLKVVFLGRAADGLDARPYNVETVRFHKGYALIRFEETPDRNAADLLRDYFVMIDLANAVPLEEDEFYLYELIGLEVQTQEGVVVGTITDVLETGANDVYILEDNNGRELLIPAHDETIVEIDLDAGIVTVNLPEGLIPPV